MDEDDDVEVYEMVATVAAWDGQRGYMLSEDGEHVSISRGTWARPAFTVPLKIGDRIHCWVRAEVRYTLEKIRIIEPLEPSADQLRRLRELAKKEVARREGRFRAELRFPDTFTGTIESYNARKKKGYIRRDDGERMLFDRRCWSAKAAKTIKPGKPVRFQACRLSGTWVVINVLSIGEP
jgi:cold shock CspA family protein